MKLLNVTLIAVLLTVSFAVKLPSLKKTAIATQLVERDVMNALKGYDNDLSKQIQSLISLSLSQGQYDQIFEVLGEILDDLRTDRQTELSNHGVSLAAIDLEITTFNAAWNAAMKARDAALSAYVTLNDQIKTLDGQISKLEADIVTVNGQLTSTHTQHDNDVRALAQRKVNHQNTLDALDIIITDLKEIQENHGSGATDLAEIRAVVKKMKKIGNTNPLLSLVEFSTTFDPETLADVIGKLEKIRSNVLNSMSDDQSDQVKSDAQYAQIVQGLTAQLKGYQADHTTKTKTRATKKVQYNEEVATYDRESGKYDKNYKNWEDATADRAVEVARHTVALAKIDSEIDTVSTAIEILSKSLGYVKDEMNQDDTYRTDLDD